MPRPVRALLLDDDPSALAVLKHELLTAVPDLEVDERSTPDVSGPAYDVYVVDNDFDGRAFAGTLLETIRTTAPEALVLAWSARLDAPTLKRLVNAGCDGAFAKQDRDEMRRAVGIVVARADALRRPARRKGRPVAAVLDAVTTLLREWNRRLDSEDAATVRPATSPGAGR